jgi:hypothetical protein
VDVVNMNKGHMDVDMIVSGEDGNVANIVERDMVDDTSFDSEVDAKHKRGLQ